MILSGGIHTRPAQPLPKDLEEWVEGAGSDGFIFFSLGSAVKPSSMPEEMREGGGLGEGGVGRLREKGDGGSQAVWHLNPSATG
ncbi:hypothetical protein Pmani_011294 [Petrolisthes manimaculis]|uniref:Uncharacterized protein n=1 Tax=Petrolisthes manimaculis TaxID=1843537 RepID=A0AAE1Q1D6_9EUCA|nr:hypothetical protein Pmani_011294 [Petrolisthes manimaculis]